MDIYVPIETYRRYLTAIRILQRIIAFAKEMPETERTVMAYTVPREEIRDARQIISELEA